MNYTRKRPIISLGMEFIKQSMVAPVSVYVCFRSKRSNAALPCVGFFGTVPCQFSTTTYGGLQHMLSEESRPAVGSQSATKRSVRPHQAQLGRPYSLSFQRDVPPVPFSFRGRKRQERALWKARLQTDCAWSSRTYRLRLGSNQDRPAWAAAQARLAAVSPFPLARVDCWWEHQTKPKRRRQQQPRPVSLVPAALVEPSDRSACHCRHVGSIPWQRAHAPRPCLAGPGLGQQAKAMDCNKGGNQKKEDRCATVGIIQEKDIKAPDHHAGRQ